jgi:ABC-2 type transport system ATP-binding protein
LPSEEIGTDAAAAQITLYELATQGASLEEAYMSLTEDSVDFRSSSDGQSSVVSGVAA